MNKLINLRLLLRRLWTPQEQRAAVLTVPGNGTSEPQEWQKRIARIHALIEERKAAQRFVGAVDRDAA
jgi:hypothetical protein